MPGIEVRISRTEGEDAAHGAILVCGPNVMAGYLGNPQATAEVLQDGWLHTGDLGRLDADGYLYVVGRSTDVIVGESGQNVFPAEIQLGLAHLDREMGPESRLLRPALAVE